MPLFGTIVKFSAIAKYGITESTKSMLFTFDENNALQSTIESPRGK